jgi:4-hydroxy-3-methylbut-2-en-1-yl diphosphate synthase IspG/GcpE
MTRKSMTVNCPDCGKQWFKLEGTTRELSEIATRYKGHCSPSGCDADLTLAMNGNDLEVSGDTDTETVVVT